MEQTVSERIQNYCRKQAEEKTKNFTRLQQNAITTLSNDAFLFIENAENLVRKIDGNFALQFSFKKAQNAADHFFTSEFGNGPYEASRYFKPEHLAND